MRDTGLVVAVIIGALVALLPVLIPAIDNMLAASTTTSESTPVTSSENIVVLNPTATSSTGSDTLKVSPAEVRVRTNTTFMVKTNCSLQTYAAMSLQ